MEILDGYKLTIERNPNTDLVRYSLTFEGYRSPIWEAQYETVELARTLLPALPTTHSLAVDEAYQFAYEHAASMEILKDFAA